MRKRKITLIVFLSLPLVFSVHVLYVYYFLGRFRIYDKSIEEFTFDYSGAIFYGVTSYLIALVPLAAILIVMYIAWLAIKKRLVGVE